MERLVRTELKAHFRPEFLNRVDDIIIFHSLSEEQIAAIVEVQLQRLEKRLAQQNLHLELDKSAKKLLAKEGYDPQFGARPLEAGDPGIAARSAGHEIAGRRVQVRRQH